MFSVYFRKKYILMINNNICKLETVLMKLSSLRD